MKGKLLGMVLAALLLVVAGCGGGNDGRPLIETRIPSDLAVDADIVNAGGVLTVTRASTVNGIFAGVDPGNDDVYRAFLHFPLTTVPLNARIRSAELGIVIRSVTVLPPTATIPIWIELVSFDPPVVASDFDRTLLLPLESVSISPPISSADVNREVVVDVTPLMVEAQLRGLRFFQVRIFQENDFTTAVPGMIEIDESTQENAPLLTVVYD
jgi:hypothetical protein